MRDKRKCKKEGRTCNLTRKNGNASSKEEKRKRDSHDYTFALCSLRIE